ncbi:MAG: hypothetical protein Q8P05_00955 [Candidatus Diapherotrites archaeon]|nr:hypothetical protein [Candidatus Diapherotrites archaeon]MDZ4256989.1 hypothetical protein [archaeon]
MTRLVVDTSALISLSYSGRLKGVCAHFEINIPSSVKDELKEMAVYSDHLSKMAKESLALITQKKIRLHDKKITTYSDRHITPKIDHGEAACFELALVQKIPHLILDDISAAHGLSVSPFSKKIDLKLSVALLVSLHTQKKITKSELQKSLRAMIQNRKWGKSAMERAIQKYFD